jgi:hypothetical protein
VTGPKLGLNVPSQHTSRSSCQPHSAPCQKQHSRPIGLSSNFYARTDLTQIIQRSAHLLGVRIDDEGAGELAARSRGTPRIANRLLRRIAIFIG